MLQLRRQSFALAATIAVVACSVTFRNPPGWQPERNVFVLHLNSSPRAAYQRVVAAVLAESLAVATGDSSKGVLAATPFHISSYGNDYEVTIHASVAAAGTGADVTLSGHVRNTTSAGVFDLPLMPSRSGAWARLQRIADRVRPPQ